MILNLITIFLQSIVSIWTMPVVSTDDEPQNHWYARWNIIFFRELRLEFSTRTPSSCKRRKSGMYFKKDMILFFTCLFRRLRRWDAASTASNENIASSHMMTVWALINNQSIHQLINSQGTNNLTFQLKFPDVIEAMFDFSLCSPSERCRVGQWMPNDISTGFWFPRDR